MPLLGNIVNSALKLKNLGQIAPFDALKAQEKELRWLLRKAVDTQYGSRYHFGDMLESDDTLLEQFKSTVPLNDYDTINDEWWYKCREGQADVTWPGFVRHFALSSGTSGASSKYIPVTKDMIKQIRKTSIREIFNLPKFNLPKHIYSKGALMLGGSTDLNYNGIYYAGDLSGISTGKIPRWFQKYYYPGREISKEKDWPKKIDEIVHRAKDWDIGAIVGVPSWFQILMEQIIEEYGLQNIHEIWPNLEIFVHGGVSFKPYKSGFEKLLAHPLVYMETYLASEGFLALQNEPGVDYMQLVVDNGIFFEFLPFNEQNFDATGNVVRNARTLSLKEVKENETYALVISTCAGAWRYLIGDTIVFTDVQNCNIKITGRTKHYLSVCGEHLSQDNMNKAVELMEKDLNISVKEFTVAGIEHEKMFAHHWYLGTDDEVSVEDAKNSIDNHLKILNDDYKTERLAAINEVIITVLPSKVFYAFMEHIGKMGAQFKFPRVLREKQLHDWEEFVKNHKY